MGGIRSSLGAIAVLGVFLVLGLSSAISAGDGEKAWTVMIYLDADNNLESAALMNMDWLENVGSSGDVNYLVLLDTLSGGTELLYIEDVDVRESVLLNDDYDFLSSGEVNMADPEVLEEFIEIGVNDFPAVYYAVILWDHGGGWRGICWDDTTEELSEAEDAIYMDELRDAFAGAYEDTGVVIDIVGFDACLMAMPEVAYELRDYADYLIFSEETIYGTSFPYEMIATDLNAEPGMGPLECVEMMASDYADFYVSNAGYPDWTISTFDMAYMDDLYDAVDYLGSELLASLNYYVNAYQNARVQSDEYYYFYNVDLWMFANNLLMDPVISDPGIREAAGLVKNAVDDAVTVCYNSWHNRDSMGVAIYFPYAPGSTIAGLKPEYEEISFATATSWFDFVDGFSHFSGRSWYAEK